MQHLRQGNLSDTVATTIGRRIVSGEYKPGDTLPTEPNIQQEFGVSRTAVREAVRLLSAKGLTRSRPKIGTRVRPVTDWHMLDPDVLRWQLDQRPDDEFIGALFEMREIVEPAAAERAAERASAEEVERLGVALAGMAAKDRGSPEHVRADLDYHMLILDASRNPLLRSLGSMIDSALSIVFSLGWRTAVTEEVIRHHRNVYEAIRDHDGNAAGVAMRDLLRNSKANFFDMLRLERRHQPPPSSPLSSEEAKHQE